MVKSQTIYWSFFDSKSNWRRYRKKRVGKLGALIVEGKDGGKFIKTNVGSGLTDSDRETYWKDKDKLIGQVVEVRADAITQNQDAKDEWSLRFPRFLRFRGFKVGEKL